MTDFHYKWDFFSVKMFSFRFYKLCQESKLCTNWQPHKDIYIYASGRRRDLRCIEDTNFYQYLHYLGVKPTTLAPLTQCSIATGMCLT